MSKGFMEITTRIGCRVNCAYCPQSTLLKAYAKRGGEKIFDFDSYLECLGKIPKEIRISFAGMAEPWLHPRCTDMVLAAHEAGHGIDVYTTLCGMTHDDIDRLADIPFALFAIHLPDDSGQTHIDDTDDYRSLLQRLCESPLQEQRLLLLNGPARKDIAPIIDNFPDLLAFSPHTRGGNIENELTTAHSLAEPIICREMHPHYNQNILMPNGDVLACCMDYGMEYIYGNLLTDAYADLFSGEGFNRLKQERLQCGNSGLCKKCEYAVSLFHYWAAKHHKKS